MHDEVGAEFDRTLQHRRTEGVVDREDQAMLLREGGDLGEIDQLQQRIGRRFGPDHARVRTQGGLQCREVVQIDIAEIEPGGAAAHAFEQAISAAVHVVHRDDVTAGIERVEHGRGRGQAGREGVTLAAAFERGDAVLVGETGRVVRARVFEALMVARAALHIRAGRVDRRHHRAGARVGFLSGVDGARAEAAHEFRLGHDSPRNGRVA